MLLRLNPAQQAHVSTVQKVVNDTIATTASAVDKTGVFPRAGISALGQAGLLGLTVPKEFGGLGGDLRTGTAAVRTLGTACPSTAMVYTMHLCGIAVYAGAPQVAGDMLRAAAAGNHLTTLAWSERGSRSHFWAPVSRIHRDGPADVVSAEKSWVTSAGEADGYVVSAGMDGGGINLYLTNRDEKGQSVAGPWDALGMRGNASAPMKLDGVRLDRASRLLNADGQGLGVMLGVVLPVFSFGQAANSLGICEAVIAATTAHLTSAKMEHLGSRLCDVPLLRANLAEMRLLTDRATAHVDAALHACETGSPVAQLQVLEIKASCAETALAVTDLAMRTCGGAAFSKQTGVERFFRDARSASVMAPTTDLAREFIGKALCGLPLF